MEESEAKQFEQLYENLEQENKELRSQNTNLSQSASMFGQQDKGNLIEWSLDPDAILEKLEHFLKGTKVVMEDGNVSYVEQDNEDLIILNEYGVNSIMQILGNYVNKTIFLSIYEIERIYEILGDLGDEIARFIYCNYEKMGMTTEFKKSRFNLLVLNIIHIVESAYRRALRGKTLEEVSTARVIVPTSNYNAPMDSSQATPERKSGFRRFLPF